MPSDAGASRGALQFLNAAEADTLDALADVILPGDADDPGARVAGATTYVDRGLAGFFRELQTFYRTGLRALDAHCASGFGRRFVELDDEQRHGVVSDLDARATTNPADPLGRLFRVVREHVVQGFFCDPVYGGNRALVGWRLVGFPGAQWGYTNAQRTRDYDATAIPLVTLDDLYARRRSAP